MAYYDLRKVCILVVEDAPFMAKLLRAIQENWPKIKFHALREHAGLVFQQRMGD